MVFSLVFTAASALVLATGHNPRIAVSTSSRHTFPHLLASPSPPPPPPLPPPVERFGGDSDDGNSDDGEFKTALMTLIAQLSTVCVPAMRSIQKFPLIVPVALFALYRPFRRAVRSQKNLAPIIVRLKLFDRRSFETPEARLAAQQELDEVLSTRLADFIGEMRGAFVKAAQVLGSLEPVLHMTAPAQPMASYMPRGRYR